MNQIHHCLRVNKTRGPSVMLGAAAVLFGVLAQTPAAFADEGAVALAPGLMMEVAPATKRSVAEMRGADAAASRAPGFDAKAAQGLPFRSTMTDTEYRAAKDAAHEGLSISEGAPGKTLQAQIGSLAPPSLLGNNFEGLNQIQSGGLRPPDTHGAMGNGHYCQIVNTRLACYQRAAPNTQVLNVSLAAFYGYTLQTLFDPRIVYDPTWDRWVATAEARPESATVQRQFIAISRTSNPTGAWWIYGVDVNIFNNDDFWDYPQLGMDQDAVIMTANIFGPTGYRETRMFAVAKARVYNGLGWNTPMWTGLVGTLAPPMVLDQNSNTYLVAAPPVGSTVWKYTLQNSANAFDQTLAVSMITVPAYTVPPNASQPGTAATLDTLDSRFVNVSTQIGDSLFQVHTIGFPPYPIPKWYEFDVEGAGVNTIKQSGFFWAGATSHDWMASIAANASRDIYVVWSSTNAAAGTNAQIRFSGKEVGDATTFFGPGQSIFTSPTFYTQFRWGDYSAVALDPLNTNRAWITAEKINANTVWGSRIARIGW